MRCLLQAQSMGLTEPLPRRCQHRAQPPVCTGPGLEGSAFRRISREGTQKPTATCPRPSSQGRSAMWSMPGFNRQDDASGQEEVGSRTLGTGNCPSNCLCGGLIPEALSSCEGPAPLSFSSFQPFTESKSSFHLRFLRAFLNKN